MAELEPSAFCLRCADEVGEVSVEAAAAPTTAA